uniref:histidine kinase n=1 Tax=Magnetococcus massalia (strain MO-1) TaxID=451514 RepID=A0A1S7LJY1_MAGMO|nr:Putative signal transduction histidine kinase [Candidatus Magnetococcus massalia]
MITSTTEKPRILLVDDMPANLVALRAILEGIEAEFVDASSGTEALTRSLEQEFAVILLDVQLPEMSGFEVAQFLHSAEQTRHIPIIFITAAYTKHQDTLKGYSVGAIDYILKPLDEDILRSKVNFFLELYHKQHALEALTAQLQSNNEALEREIALRRQYEEELTEARQAAEVANMAKSEFLAVMSHEIRTPLNAILGMSELLKDTPLSETQAWCVKTLNRSGETLLTLINDILDLSKIEAGQLALEQTPFPLHHALEELIELFSFSALDKGIALDLDIHPRVPSGVSGDPTRLRQVLLNLLSNAVKFTERGQIDLTVSIDEGERITFAVSDTGPGIPEEKCEAIFKPFTQADASTTRKHGGSGLGLTICRRLVELMGGELHVETILEEGSTFSFTLPLPAVEHEPWQREKSDHPFADLVPPANDHEGVASQRGLTILLADDAEDNRLLIKAYLKREPHELVMVEDGKAALEAFKARSFDLVLMDIQMPVMDGNEATRHIRQWEAETAATPTPIAALTAHAMLEQSVEIKASGCDLHLTKPIRKKQLLQAIQDLTR